MDVTAPEAEDDKATDVSPMPLSFRRSEKLTTDCSNMEAKSWAKGWTVCKMNLQQVRH